MSIEIVQTLYLGSNNEDPIKVKSGFLSPEFHWMSWALSCLQLHRLYGIVRLYTNKAGKEILIDRLKLPYTEVYINELKGYGKLWSLGKMHTYNMQKKPFLHVDGDVFIWEKFDDGLMSSNLIAQNIEFNHVFYQSIFNELESLEIKLPECIAIEFANQQQIRSCNAGIIGGSDLQFFKNYVLTARNFIEQNFDQLNKAKNKDINMIPEQYFFYAMAKRANQQITCFIPDEVTDMNYKGLVNFADVPFKSKYVHLLGSYKNSDEACIMLANRLRKDYPEYYYQIIDEVKSAGVRLYLSYYHHKSTDNDDPINWEKLYLNDIKQYALIEGTFADDQSFQLAYFSTNQFISESHLTLKDGEEIMVYTIPFSYKKKFTDIECDELDQLIIGILKEQKTFRELMENMLSYIEGEQTTEELNMLNELIKLKLQRGCNNGLYWIESNVY